MQPSGEKSSGKIPSYRCLFYAVSIVGFRRFFLASVDDVAGDGLVDQEGDEGVGPGLDEVKGQDHRQDHGVHRLCGHTREERGDEVVGDAHDNAPADGAQTEADGGAGPGVLHPVDAAGHQDDGGGGDDVHDDAVKAAAGADGIMVEVHNNPSCALCDGAQSLTPEQFAMAVACSDSKMITKAQGVGTKIAQRICLELKDKIGSLGADGGGDFVAPTVSASSNAAEAVDALVVLGFSKSEASSVIGKLDSSKSVEELIKLGLGQLNKLQ